MSHHFGLEVNLLKQRLLNLACEVMAMLEKTAFALQTINVKCASEVIQADAAIDSEEVKIEEECLRLIDCYHPVAADLRLLITILKVNGEVERIADLTTDIAERIFIIAGNEPTDSCEVDFSPMLTEVQKMLRDALQSLVNCNPTLARMVILEDDTVDQLDRAFDTLASKYIKKDERFALYAHNVSLISHAIERIADCTTNICEDVIYLENGTITRHMHQKEGKMAPCDSQVC